MGGGYLGDAGVFLVDTIVGLYMLVVLLRLLFQMVRADFFNPISQFIVTVTNPPLVLLRKVIPGFWGIDWAAVFLLFGLALVKRYLLDSMIGRVPDLSGALLLALADVLQLIVYTLIVAVLIRVVLSWIGPRGYHPVVNLLVRITEPVMAPARRLIPSMGGLDLSPILVFIVLHLVLRLIVQPLLDYGRVLAG